MTDASIAAREPQPQHRELFDAFVEEVRERFGFLTERGFAEHEARWPWVEYRSPTTRLIFTMRPAASGEHFFAELWFEATGTPERGPFLDLADLFELEHPGANRAELDSVLGRRFFGANDREQIRGSLERLDGVLRTEGLALLEQRPGLLEALRRDASERDREAELASLRPAAEAAFKAGDWATVVRELEPFADKLKRSELKKLDYARRRL